METDLVERIVDWVIESQEAAESKFHGYHYGDDFVVRDHGKERVLNKTVEVFRAPYKLVDNQDVLDRVRRNFVVEELRGCLKNRPQQLIQFATENLRS